MPGQRNEDLGSLFMVVETALAPSGLMFHFSSRSHCLELFNISFDCKNIFFFKKACELVKKRNLEMKSCTKLTCGQIH